MARRSGARGSVYLAGSVTKLTDTLSWEFEENQEVLECSVKGERFRRYVADVGHGRVRINSFIASDVATPLTGPFMNADIVAAHGVGTRVAFVLDQTDGNIIVSGSGYLVRSQVHVARDGALSDEMEIEVDGPLTTVN